MGPVPWSTQLVRLWIGQEMQERGVDHAEDRRGSAVDEHPRGGSYYRVDRKLVETEIPLDCYLSWTSP
jgi:hypothetical protein